MNELGVNGPLSAAAIQNGFKLFLKEHSYFHEHTIFSKIVNLYCENRSSWFLFIEVLLWKFSNLPSESSVSFQFEQNVKFLEK